MSFQALLTLIVTWLLLTGIESGSARPAVQEIAQSSNQPLERSNSLNAPILFSPPPQDGAPSTTRGAGSRDDRRCSQDSSLSTSQTAEQSSLTALVPSDHYGLTWSARPTFWVYVPQTSARQIVLSVKQGNQHHSQRFIPITGQPGVIGIQAAENSSPLEVGKTYQWAIVLVCGDRPSPNDPVVSAWVRRAQPTEPLSSQTTLQQAARYGKQGIWYDALTTLAEAKRSQPNNADLDKTWTRFLTQPSVGLGAIATEPLR
ncbi:DUF928 domain-containing protein [Cyanobacteria bacterium FACHB-63]|nr:DUF928 domain-containing protein [Cyanobacteria bacterium FACHB-63]